MTQPRRKPERLPRARRRGIGMIRVSKERDGMTSPETQRYIIEQFAERENIEIVEWIEGIDESGSRKKSAWWARLSYACDLIEAGTADALLFWRIDRTARNRLKWALTEDRIDTAGGEILSATELNDRTPAGQFGRGVMVEHSIFMAKMIGATWTEQLERRVRNGLTPNGQRHYGYVYDRPSGTYALDPIEAPILAAMYRAYIGGDAAYVIAARHSSSDARPGADGSHERYARWSTAAVLRLLDSGFGAGFILFRGERHPGVHPPVITADEWTLYRHARETRRRRPRAERSPYAYSGLIYCHCGSKMSGRTDHGVRRYTCVESIQYARQRHMGASLAEHIVDDAVLAWLDKIRAELNAAAEEAPRRPSPVQDPSKEIARRIAAASMRIDSATEKLVDGLIPEDSYRRLRARIEAEIAALEDERLRASAQATVRPIAFVGDLVAQWPDLPVERRREALRLLIDRLNVRPPGSVPRVLVESPLARS